MSNRTKDVVVDNLKNVAIGYWMATFSFLAFEAACIRGCSAAVGRAAAEYSGRQSPPDVVAKKP